jgi:Protein of unknown function (DUF2793)
MARTAQLDLPLVMPAQAQKHVTVNEALARLDAVAQLRVVSSSVATPPVPAADGASYLVPPGASGDWQGQAGSIAVWCNGGWLFVAPKAGWRAWDESRQGHQMYDGQAWISDAVAVSSGGAAFLWKVIEFDHHLSPGASNLTAVAIPSHAQVVGVTGRVAAAISGSGLTGWRAGVGGSDNRYGSGLGLTQGSYLLGLSGAPVTYYADTPLLLSAEGGAFASGIIRLALHVVQIQPPRAV